MSNSNESSSLNPLKRKRETVIEDGLKGASQVIEDDQLLAANSKRTKANRSAQLVTAVRNPNLIFPKSIYRDYEELLQVSSERDVLKEAMVKCTSKLYERISVLTQNIGHQSDLRIRPELAWR